MKLCFSLSLILACLLSSACGGLRAWTPATLNSSCPISGRPVEREAGKVVWQDKSVGFCSTACVAPWNALEESEKLSELKAAVQSHAGHPH